MTFGKDNHKAEIIYDIRAVWPEIPEPSAWVQYLCDSIDQNWHSNFGPASRRFEAEMLNMFGGNGETVVATSSATSAISASLIAHGVSGQVPCPAFTFQATAGAILGAGCEPFIMDVDPVTGAVTPEVLDQALQATGARAAVVVAPYGLTCDFRKHAEVCHTRSARLIIDNAAGLGVARGAQVGLALGDTVDEVYSLHATKVFGVGEGGLIFTSPLYEGPIRSAINFGLPSHTSHGQPKEPFWGINGKMSESAAAIGLAVAETFLERVCSRQVMAAEWIHILSEFPDMVYCCDVTAGPWQCFPIRLPTGEQSQALIEAMKRQHIELRQYYRPSLGSCSGMPSLGECSIAQNLSERAIILPVRSYMPADKRRQLMDTVHKGIKGVMFK